MNGDCNTSETQLKKGKSTRIDAGFDLGAANTTAILALR